MYRDICRGFFNHITTTDNVIRPQETKYTNASSKSNIYLLPLIPAIAGNSLPPIWCELLGFGPHEYRCQEQVGDGREMFCSSRIVTTADRSRVRQSHGEVGGQR